MATSTRDKAVFVRVSNAEKRVMERAAAEQRLSLSAWVRVVLLRHLGVIKEAK